MLPSGYTLTDACTCASLYVCVLQFIHLHAEGEEEEEEEEVLLTAYDK